MFVGIMHFNVWHIMTHWVTRNMYCTETNRFTEAANAHEYSAKITCNYI